MMIIYVSGVVYHITKQNQKTQEILIKNEKGEIIRQMYSDDGIFSGNDKWDMGIDFNGIKFVDKVNKKIYFCNKAIYYKNGWLLDDKKEIPMYCNIVSLKLF